MSSPSSSSPLQPYHVRNLILILRRANDHYSHVASRIRASLVPTHHARKRAHRMGLAVDVAKAVACDQRQVSIIPLPVIDIVPTPVISTWSPVSPTFETIRMQAQELRSIDGRSPIKRRPALKCVIPVVTRTAPNGATSALSPSSVYSALADLSPAVILNKVFSRREAIPEEDYHYSIDVSMDEHHDSAETTQEWQPLDVSIDEDAMDWGLELDDLSDMEHSSPMSSAGSVVSNSSDTASSTGPATPVSSSDSLSFPVLI